MKMTTTRPCLIAPQPRKDVVLQRLFSSTTDDRNDDDSSSSSDHARDQLTVLRRLESTTYQPQDYYATLTEDDEECSIVVSRQATVEYLYQISDYGGFERHVVAYAMTNLLDRYLSSSSHNNSAAARKTLCDKNHYQWVSLTCLYMAVKLLEPQNIGIDSLVPLTNHMYTVQDFCHMERTILRQLQWRVAHGPTSLDFTRLFLQHLPSHVSPPLATQLFHQSQYQLELAVADYELCTGNLSSDLAVAALWNALEWTNDVQEFSVSDQSAFQRTIKRVLLETSPQDCLDWNANTKCLMEEERIPKIQSKVTNLVLDAYSSNRNANIVLIDSSRDGSAIQEEKRGSPVTTVKEALDSCGGKHRTLRSDRESVRDVTQAELLLYA